MNDIIQIVFQTIIGILSVTGGLCCIYYIFCRMKKDLYIKGNAYLILDIDTIGDKLEYYIRRIQNDINNKYIYISKIILYSKSLRINNEIYNICRILAQDYNNIIFINNYDGYDDYDKNNKNNILNILFDVT